MSGHGSNLRQIHIRRKPNDPPPLYVVLCLLRMLGGLGYKINSINTGLFSYPKSPIDSFGVNLLQWCENRSRRIL